MKLPTYFGVLLIGSTISFALGWQLKSLLGPDKPKLAQTSSGTLPNESQADNDGSTSVAAADVTAAPKESKVAEIIQSPGASSDANDFKKALNDLALLGQQLENGELVEDMDDQISRFMDIAIELGSTVWNGEDQANFNRFATKILDSKPLYGAFLEHYPTLSNSSDQNGFASIFLNPRMVNSPFREEFILDKIKSGEQSSKWLKTLSGWGVQEASTVDYLLDQIPYLNDPDDLAAAISASTNVVRPKGTGDSVFMPAREDAAALYEQYFDSQEDAVRAAAIGTLKSFPHENTEELVMHAMSDKSSGVKQQAISVIRGRKLKSKDIQDSLLTLIRDENESLHIRSFAVAALRETAQEGSISMEIVEIANAIRQSELIKMQEQP